MDFHDLWVVLRGVKTKTALFTMRLSFSGRAAHRASLSQGQEAFLEAHVYAFERLGGVPWDKIRYDNLKPAVSRVLCGRTRQETQRWVLFRSHYGFDPFYCVPGNEGSHEKGGVEGEGWPVSVATTASRCRWWTRSRSSTSCSRRGMTPTTGAGASGMFTPTHDAFWAAARKALGDGAGTRVLVEVLLLHRHLERDDVLAGVSAALSVGSVNVDVVAVEARKAARRRGAAGPGHATSAAGGQPDRAAPGRPARR